MKNFSYAKMNPDSQITSDLTDKDTESQYFNSLKYVNALGDGSTKINPEVLKEMRGDIGYITDFTSRPDYTIKTIHKEYAETQEGAKRIAIAKETADMMNKVDLDREYYVRVDGIKKEVVVESVSKANSYNYHLKESLLHPFKKGIFEYAYNSFENLMEYKFKESLGEIGAGIGSLTDPLTIGVGRKLSDNIGRVEAGSIQYGSKEDLAQKVEILKDSGRNTGDFVATSITLPLVSKGISKGKEVINNFTEKNSANLKEVIPNESIKLSNKGNTGRDARDLVEQLTMEEVKSNPSIGNKTKIGLKDSRWSKEDGWQKWSYEKNDFYNHSKVEIHYNVCFDSNGNLMEVDDFKVKYPR